MTTILATAIIVLAAVAALVSLVDSSLIARQVAVEIARERALARMGFVAQVTARELRPRPALAARPAQTRAGGLMQASRLRALPLRFAAPACDAA
jgi:hypothetical protein